MPGGLLPFRISLAVPRITQVAFTLLSCIRGYKQKSICPESRLAPTLNLWSGDCNP